MTFPAPAGGGPGGSPEPPGQEPREPRLSVLTFEAGDFVLGVVSGEVTRLVPPGEALPEGVSVIDTVGLLPRSAVLGRERRRGCSILLAAGAPGGRALAVTASRAGSVRMVEPGRLLPLPGFLFPKENPFMGIIPAGEGDGERPVFVLAGPERILACAGAR